MSIRLTDSVINNTILQSMLSNQSSLTKLSTEISSDSKISVASDDPLSASTILQTNTALDKNTTYTNAVSSAQSELTTTDTSLVNLVNIITKAKSLATQAANDHLRNQGEAPNLVLLLLILLAKIEFNCFFN